ncbi:TPA: RteC domain-containing protein [Elizabethkingia anophelis]|uniref:RteC domain-containing protein n=1 Tax=Elizabethkingia anophelis TaxID=1117645 RepID=UPI003734868E
MEKFYNETLTNLETTIGYYKNDVNYPIHHIEIIIDNILKSLADLKVFVLNRGFKSMEEEIHFFKFQKPLIVSKLIYYNAIYKIETKKPYGIEPVKRYLKNEEKKLKRFFENNLEFYKYYRTNNTYMDDKLFVRGNYDIKLCLDTFYFDADNSFSTTHDYKAAKILANDLLYLYIENRLSETVYKSKGNNLPKLSWRASKTSLTELIYALFVQNVFDNTDIKVIAKTLESVFNIELGDFYHTFMEIKSRKINRTKFLDSLREGLIKKMDEQDE